MNNNNIIKVCMYRNFDDDDDFKEQELELENVGEYIYKQEKLGWKLDQDEHSISEQMFLLSLKSDYLYDKIIEEMYSVADNLNFDLETND